MLAPVAPAHAAAAHRQSRRWAGRGAAIGAPHPPCRPGHSQGATQATLPWLGHCVRSWAADTEGGGGVLPSPTSHARGAFDATSFSARILFDAQTGNARVGLFRDGLPWAPHDGASAAAGGAADEADVSDVEPSPSPRSPSMRHAPKPTPAARQRRPSPRAGIQNSAPDTTPVRLT